MTYHFNTSNGFAIGADKADVLSEFRKEFFIPEKKGNPLIYFCGNSLGLEPKSAKKFLEIELEDWALLGVDGHFHAHNPWLNYHKFLQQSLAEIMGALPAEVVPANSLTVNLHLLLTTFYRPKGKKVKILVDGNPFSSDWYALNSQIKLKGLDPGQTLIEIEPEAEDGILSTRRVLESLEENKYEVALIFFSGVHFLTGQVFELEAICRKAQELEIPIGLDLAHAVGNVELKLHDWQCDFAVWCSYKYLNSGPGGTGGFFVHEKHARNSKLPRLAGWWGQNESIRFEMTKEFDPTPSAEGWQLSNAPVLSLAVQRASLEIFSRAGMRRLREKSRKLTGYLSYLLYEKIISASNPYHISILTPDNPEERGCQLSLKVGKHARELLNKLADNGIIIDFRQPDIIRVSPVPLYNTFREVYQFVSILEALTTVKTDHGERN